MKGIHSISQVETQKLFTTNGTDAWKVDGYCEQPTAWLVNLETGERLGGAVGCLNLADFVPLVPKE